MDKHKGDFESMSKGKQVSRRTVLATFGAVGAALTVGSAGWLVGDTIGQQKGKGEKMYKTANDLRKDTGLEAGVVVHTFGYYHVGDGGAAQYMIGETNAAVDGGSVLELDNGLKAILLPGEAVNYKMFGAVGNGDNDDGIQIMNAHSFCNKHGIPIVNLSGEYWIKQTINIVISTNVQWGHTIFHLDEKHHSQVLPRFEIADTKNSFTVQLSEGDKRTLLSVLKPGVHTISTLAPYKNCLIVIADENDRIGARHGFSNQWWAREELFYVEEHGRIVGEIAWPFENYTRLTAYPCSDSYLVIDGGTFYLSGEPAGNRSGPYRFSGFRIKRSRTIIRNQWVGLEPGQTDNVLDPRRGFYFFNYVYDVTLENIRLIPNEQNRGSQATNVAQGTYGIGGNRLMNVTLRNVTAEGSYVHWGVLGTNLNKNFRVENCKLNRIDVHFHCWNLDVLDSQIGNRGFTVTGGGRLRIENTSVLGSTFISFRQDYGARWDGPILLKNCTLKSTGTNDSQILQFVPADFDYKYDIGYGRTIRVENFVFDYRGNPSNSNQARIIQLASFSKNSAGHRVFFPSLIDCRNISVVGREPGIRIMEIQKPDSYRLEHKGGYDGQIMTPNCRMYFEELQLETMPAVAPTSTRVHFLLNASVNDVYEDEYALYPSIHFVRCGEVNARLYGSIADAAFKDCLIQSLSCEKDGPMRGRLSFEDCRFLPRFEEEGAFYRLESSLGTYFTRCTMHAPVVGGRIRPDLLHLFGFVSINESVRFNHLLTKLSKEITDYYHLQSAPVASEFMDMLASQHEQQISYMIRRQGTTAQRNLMPDSRIPRGTLYFDTDLGSLVLWNGQQWNSLLIESG